MRFMNGETDALECCPSDGTLCGDASPTCHQEQQRLAESLEVLTIEVDFGNSLYIRRSLIHIQLKSSYDIKVITVRRK